jgi:phage tail-like protein
MISIRRVLVAIGGPVAFACLLWIPVSSANAQTTVLIEVDGLFNAYVTSAVGVGSETEVVEHKVVDATGQEIVRKIPGRLKYLDIAMERGITSNLDLANWRELVETGRVENARADIIVTALDIRMAPVAKWSGTACWPSRIENLLPDPESGAGEVVEKLVIVCEGLARTE